MAVTDAELLDLDRSLARGPHLVEDAVLGASVGILIGWFSGVGRGAITNAAMGAAAGGFVSILRYSGKQWMSKHGHADLESKLGSFDSSAAKVGGYRAGLAPYPYYRASTTYPWSSH